MANFYSFKANPKQKVVDKAKALFGRDSNVKVIGTRPSPLTCKSLGLPEGTYYVECFVNNKLIANANLKNWRKAYGLLVTAVERAFEETLYRV
jgi:hypothetical protein